MYVCSWRKIKEKVRRKAGFGRLNGEHLRENGVMMRVMRAQTKVMGLCMLCSMLTRGQVEGGKGGREM